MTDLETIAIIGGGLAGAKAAEALRKDGYDGRIAVFGDEPGRPTSGRRSRRTTCAAIANARRCSSIGRPGTTSTDRPAHLDARHGRSSRGEAASS